MTETIETLGGAPSGEVELGQVERELAALWATAAPDDPGAEPAVLRACSLNLLVFAGSLAEREQAQAVAAGTSLAHPSRTVLMTPEPGVRRQASDVSEAGNSSLLTSGVSRLTSGIGARISTFCHRLGSTGRHVCCEEITLLAQGEAAGRLPEAALPLLLPDLPVYLWIAEHDETSGVRRQASDPQGRSTSGRPGFAGLTPDASRLTSGSSHAFRIARLSLRLAELADVVVWSARGPRDRVPARAARLRPVVALDLDWMRLAPWRELTAQLFDPPDRRPLLEAVEALQVTVAGPLLPRPGAAWLWIGWLASRLGWVPAEEPAPAGEAGTVRLRGPSGPITASVSVQEQTAPDTQRSWVGAALPAGELIEFRLYLRGAGFPSKGGEPLSLTRVPTSDPADLCIHEVPERYVHVGRRDPATLLSEALDSHGRDRVYEAAWSAALRLWGETMIDRRQNG